MAVVSIEDLTGKIEAVLFPKIYTAYQPFLQEDSFVKIKGKADKRNGEWQMVVESLTSHELEKAREEAQREGLLDEKEEVVNVRETVEDLESAPEEEMAEEAISEEINTEESSQEEPQAQSSETTETKISKETRYTIHLPDEFPRTKMQQLNHLLSQNEGDEEVELHFHGHNLVFPLKVEVTEELKKEIQELVQK